MGQLRPRFLFFSITNFTEKSVDLSWIRTRIVGVEGEHADNLTTIKACLISNRMGTYLGR